MWRIQQWAPVNYKDQLFRHFNVFVAKLCSSCLQYDAIHTTGSRFVSNDKINKPMDGSQV